MKETTDETTLVEIALEVDGKPFVLKGAGECNFTGDASIYEAPATMWAVRQSLGDRRVKSDDVAAASAGSQLTPTYSAPRAAIFSF